MMRILSLGDQAERCESLGVTEGGARFTADRNGRHANRCPRPDMGRYEPAVQRWESIHGPAPDPLNNGRLNPDFVEWMMGYPAGWTDGRTKTARLKMLGNAVVPHVSELAFRTLMERTYEQLTKEIPMARMNGLNQYLVHIPEVGKRGKPVKGAERGYTRTSNVAKLLEDGNSLINWRVRTTMLGLATDRTLWERLLAMAPDADNHRGNLDALAELALDAAGANAGSTHGTALHALVESYDKGVLNPADVIGIMKDDLQSYINAMHAEGLFVLPEWSEHMIVHDDHGVAGTFDMMLGHSKDTYGWPADVVRIGDVKTTKPGSIDYAFNAYAIQIAIYANGTPYVQDPSFGGVRTEWPENFDRSKGLIVHVPAGAAMTQFYELDLEAGWEAAQHALWARQWRKRNDLASRWVAEPDAAMREALERSVEAAIGSKVVSPVLHTPAGAPERPVALQEPLAISVPDEPSEAVVAPVAAVPVPSLKEQLAAEPFVTQHEEGLLADERRKPPPGATVGKSGGMVMSLINPTPAPVAVTAPVVAAPVPQALTPVSPSYGGSPQNLRSFMPEATISATLARQAPARPSLIEQLSVDTAPAIPSEPDEPDDEPEDATLQAMEAEVEGEPIGEPNTADEVRALFQQVFGTSCSVGDANDLLKHHRGSIRPVLQGQSAAYLDIRRRAMKARLTILKQYPDELEKLTYTWPEGVPGFAGDHQHSGAELDLIEVVVSKAEGTVGLPFPDELVPTVPAPAQPPMTMKVPQPPPATPKVDDDALAVLTHELSKMMPAEQDWLNARAADCKAVGLFINPSVDRDARRFAIVRALIKAVNAPMLFEHIDQAIRIILSRTGTMAELTGSMTIDEAQQLADMAHLVELGELTCRWDGDRPVFTSQPTLVTT